MLPGSAALHVLDTGIVDYAHVCTALAVEIEEAGAKIRLGSVQSGSETRRDWWSTPPRVPSRLGASSPVLGCMPTRWREL